MGYNSKNIRAVVKNFIVEVDGTFLKMCAKNLVKVTRIGEVMSRKGPPTLRNLYFHFRYYNGVIEARCLNYANS